MIHVSAGTAAALGLKATRVDAPATTAYLLITGEACLMRCAFCPQGRQNVTKISRLGRVDWPTLSWHELERGIKSGRGDNFQRICLQSIRKEEKGIDTVIHAVMTLKRLSPLPLSVSAWINDVEEAAALFEAGAERVNIALDAVNPAAYKSFKGGSLAERLQLLLNCARFWPGRLSTHIICGLQETEEEVLSVASMLLSKGITPALFAFTPLKGTLLETLSPPQFPSYRRIQAGYFLLREKHITLSSLKFAKGRLQSYGLTQDELLRLLGEGKAFQTSGCPGCNRPYYNERPGKVPYNYPRPLEKDEAEMALFNLIGE